MQLTLSLTALMALSVAFADATHVDCSNSRAITEGESCKSIAEKENISLKLLQRINPQLRTQCDNLKAGNDICLNGKVVAGNDAKSVNRLQYFNNMKSHAKHRALRRGKNNALPTNFGDLQNQASNGIQAAQAHVSSGVQAAQNLFNGGDLASAFRNGLNSFLPNQGTSVAIPNPATATSQPVAQPTATASSGGDSGNNGSDSGSDGSDSGSDSGNSGNSGNDGSDSGSDGGDDGDDGDNNTPSQTSSAAQPSSTKKSGSGSGSSSGSGSGSGSSSNQSPAGIVYTGNENEASSVNGFQGSNNGIGSWYATNSGTDTTNGHSWCGYPYNDDVPGFAPDLSVMLNDFNGDYQAAAKAYCGLEATVTTKDGNSMLLYIADAFDPKWVRTPGSIDIIRGAWSQLSGSPAQNKNNVVNVDWSFTGRRSQDFAYGGGGWSN